MASDRDKNFDHQMNQLLLLLRKLLKNIPLQEDMAKKWAFSEKDSNFNLNVCFFNFFPMTAEEWDEIEELYENYFSHEDSGHDLSSQLTLSDLEFLKRHGIQF